MGAPHHKDFAVGFVGLLGNPAAVGEIFHITSDELLTWNAIHAIVAAAFGTEVQVVHVPSDVIAKFDPEWGASLLGDKAHSVIFDNQRSRNSSLNSIGNSFHHRRTRDCRLLPRSSRQANCQPRFRPDD